MTIIGFGMVGIMVSAVLRTLTRVMYMTLKSNLAPSDYYVNRNIKLPN